jgi:hypothetical protein
MVVIVVVVGASWKNVDEGYKMVDEGYKKLDEDYDNQLGNIFLDSSSCWSMRSRSMPLACW